MLTWIALLAAATGFMSAWCLYRASPHSRGEALRWRAGHPLGAVAAVFSLALWIVVLGVGAGISVMLANWMLALIALPYLHLRRAPTTNGERG